MTPAKMIAAAMLSGSPALLTLAAGHLAAGRPAMAMLAFYLPRETLAVLDEALAWGALAMMKKTPTQTGSEPMIIVRRRHDGLRIALPPDAIDPEVYEPLKPTPAPKKAKRKPTPSKR